MPKIILIGYRATGKSTVGRLLAEKLGLPFLDLDQYLVQKMGRSIKEAVAEKGWAYFRAREKEALLEMASRGPLVLACGGGTVLHEKEFDFLKKGALVVWLSAQPETIAERLSRDSSTKENRPSLTGKDILEEIKEVLTSRLALYQKFADLVIKTDHHSPKEVVKLIMDYLQDDGFRK